MNFDEIVKSHSNPAEAGDTRLRRYAFNVSTWY